MREIDMEVLARANKRLAELHQEELRRYESQIKLCNASFKRMLDGVSEVTADYLKYGVPYIPIFLEQMLSSLRINLMTYIAEIASALGRPRIGFETTQYWDGRYLERFIVGVPRSEKFTNVIASLLVVGKNIDNPPSRYGDIGSPVAYFTSSNRWRLVFSGPEGKEMFDQWREHNIADPVCRLVLKI